MISGKKRPFRGGEVGLRNKNKVGSEGKDLLPWGSAKGREKTQGSISYKGSLLLKVGLGKRKPLPEKVLSCQYLTLNLFENKAQGGTPFVGREEVSCRIGKEKSRGPFLCVPEKKRPCAGLKKGMRAR